MGCGSPILAISAASFLIFFLCTGSAQSPVRFIEQATLVPLTSDDLDEINSAAFKIPDSGRAPS